MQAALTVEAGVVLQNGEVRRAARIPLRLMDSDFILAIRQQKLGGTTAHASFLSFMITKEAVAGGVVADPETRKAITELESALSTHTIAAATTDFDGKATLSAPPGKYLLFGSVNHQGKTILWNLPVELAPGPNRVILDQNNAAK
jgi:hypothetical protein